MIETIDFVSVVKNLLIKGFAFAGISALTLISFATFQIWVIVVGFVEVIEQRSVLVLLQKTFTKTIWNVSFHLVLLFVLSVFLLVDLAWWWLPILLFGATFFLYYLLKAVIVVYLNSKSRKYLKLIWLMNTLRKSHFIERVLNN